MQTTYTVSALAYDSDTESEQELDKSRLQDSSDFADGLQAPVEHSSVQEVAQAVDSIELLASMRLKNIEDEPLHDAVHGAASAMLSFLHNITNSREGFDSEYCQQLFCQMLRPSFISRLFEHRQVLHSLAVEASRSLHGSVVISWVDVILAKLGDTILLIGGRGRFSFPFPAIWDPQDAALFSFMNSQTQRDQAIRVASQLPATWKDTISVLGSERISEAARRLALSLVFGSYVLYDDLAKSSVSSLVESGFLERALHSYFLTISRGQPADGWQAFPTPEPRPADTILKSQYAMAICLFAKIDISRVPHTSHDMFAYRPSTVDTLIALIEIIMTDSSEYEPAPSNRLIPFLETVNQCQSRLLGWGVTMPWCWRIWGMNDNAHLESITSLTATWLHHFASAEAVVENALHLSPVAAMTVLLPLIRVPLSPDDILGRRVLYKACWGVACLVQHHRHEIDDQLLMDACQRLLTLIHLLGFTDANALIREIAVEFIVSLTPPLIKAALEADQHSNLYAATNEAMESLVRLSGAFEDDPRQINALMDFLILVVYSGASATSCLTKNQLLPTRLSCMLRPDSTWPSTSKAQIVLLLGCLEGLEHGLAGLENISDIVCTSAVAHGSKEFIMAASFAFYVCSKAKFGLIDSLVLIEAWDYLRDVLLLMLEHENGLEELVFLLFPSLCSGLSSLFQCMDPRTVGILLNSPWTMSLYHELRKAYDTPAGSLSNARCMGTAQGLLSQMDAAFTNSEQPMNPASIINTPARLTVHRSCKDLRLVAIAVN